MQYRHMHEHEGVGACVRVSMKAWVRACVSAREHEGVGACVCVCVNMKVWVRACT